VTVIDQRAGRDIPLHLHVREEIFGMTIAVGHACILHQTTPFDKAYARGSQRHPAAPHDTPLRRHAGRHE
jgi:hypothetical protein